MTKDAPNAAQPEAKAETPRTDHYRAEFKRTKEAPSELVSWMLDEFAQEEQRFASATAELEAERDKRRLIEAQHSRLCDQVYEEDGETLKIVTAESRLREVEATCIERCAKVLEWVKEPWSSNRIVDDCIKAIRALAPDRTSVPHVDEKSGGGWVPLPHGLHPDTVELVLTFAFRLASKLRKAELKYGYDNGWKNEDWMDECRAKLREHMVKGDPIDVAAYCAFLMWHGASTATLAPDRTAAPSGGQPPTKTDSQESPAGEYLAAAVAVEPVAWIWHYPSGNSSLRWRPDHDPTSSDVPERVTPLYVALAPDRTAAAQEFKYPDWDLTPPIPTSATQDRKSVV